MGSSTSITDRIGPLRLAVLTGIVLAAVVAGLVTVVAIGGQGAVQERDRLAAIHLAESGLQHAVVALAEATPATRRAWAVQIEGGPDALVAPCDPDGEGACEADVGTSGRFRWEYRPVGERRWEVRSSGRSGGEFRTLRATVGADDLEGPLAIDARAEVERLPDPASP